MEDRILKKHHKISLITNCPLIKQIMHDILTFSKCDYFASKLHDMLPMHNKTVYLVKSFYFCFPINILG